MQSHDNSCEPDLIASYVDGDLDLAAGAVVETHVAQCRACADELLLQRRLICELDSALAQPLQLDVPHDFAEVVAAHAQSDMSGARSSRERAMGLVFSLVLALAAFTLLGAAAGKSILAAAQLFAAKLAGVGGLLGKAVYDAAAGLSVILRVAGGAMLPDAFAVLIFLLLLLAVLLLTILIATYHRYPERGLYE